jgi:pyruvate/oxaloacetate carboxyltransferase
MWNNDKIDNSSSNSSKDSNNTSSTVKVALQNGKNINGTIAYTFIPTKGFSSYIQKHKAEADGKFDIYHWTEDSGLELISENSTDYKVISEKQGIFVLAYTSNEKVEKPFVSNPECTGQCRACE